MFTRVQPKLSMLEHKFIPGTPSNQFLWMFGSISSSNTNIWNHPIEFQLKQSLLFMFLLSFQAQRFSTKMLVNCLGENPPKKNPKAPWKPKTSNKEQVGSSIYHPKFMSRWYQEDLMLEPFHMLLPSLLPMGVYFVVFFLAGGGFILFNRSRQIGSNFPRYCWRFGARNERCKNPVKNTGISSPNQTLQLQSRGPRWVHRTVSRLL